MCPSSRELHNINPRKHTTTNVEIQVALLALCSFPILSRTGMSAPPSALRRVINTRTHIAPTFPSLEHPKVPLSLFPSRTCCQVSLSYTLSSHQGRYRSPSVVTMETSIDRIFRINLWTLASCQLFILVEATEKNTTRAHVTTRARTRTARTRTFLFVVFKLSNKMSMKNDDDNDDCCRTRTHAQACLTVITGILKRKARHGRPT